MTLMSLAEARALRDAGKTLTDPNSPEGPDLGDDFWANAVLVEPYRLTTAEDAKQCA